MEFLDSVGCSEVILLTTSEQAPKIAKALSEFYKGSMKHQFEVIKANIGTAEALVKIKDKLKNDFIVMSGDLVVDKDFFFSMAEKHLTQNAAFTAALKKPAPKTEEEKKAAKKVEEESPDGDLICLTEEGRIVFWSSQADLEGTKLSFSREHLKSFPSFTLHTDLIDGHFYIFSHWVLPLLEKHIFKETHTSGITSLKGEFIPILLQLQLKKKMGQAVDFADKVSSSKEKKFISSFSSSPINDLDNFHCFALMLSSDQMCLRVNTIPSYKEANFEIAKGNAPYLPQEPVGRNNFISTSAEIDPKTQVGPESIVGEGTKIGERCGIKKSVLGKHCKIAGNVKILNSVIMDYVVIDTKCTIQNSIICSNVHLSQNCSLTSCRVAANYQCPPDYEAKNEDLVQNEL